MMRAKRAVLYGIVLTLASLPASAGDYALDPCAPLDHPGFASSAYVAAYAQLKKEASDLDRTSVAFNANCDVDKVIGTAAEVACATQQKQLKNTIDAHDAATRAFNRRLAAAVTTDVTALTARHVRTRTALTAASGSMHDFSKDAQAWVDMGERARRTARITALFTAIELVSDQEIESNTREVELGEETLSGFRAWSRTAGDAIPKELVAGVAQHVRTMRTRRDLVTLFAYMASQQDHFVRTLTPALEDRTVEAFGEFTVGGIKQLLTLTKANPEIRATITTVQMALDAGYGWAAYSVASGRINQLVNLQDSRLRAIAALGKLYVDETGRMKTLKLSNECVTKN